MFQCCKYVGLLFVRSQPGTWEYFFILFLSGLLLLVAESSWAIQCPECGSTQMEFRDGVWRCKSGHDSGAGQMIANAVESRPVVSKADAVTPWSSAAQTRQTLSTVRGRAVSGSSSNHILSCQQISEINTQLQGWCGNSLSITAHTVNNALVLAQLQLLHITHQSELQLEYAERQFNLILLVTYWILQATGQHQTESQQVLQQTQIINTPLAGQLGLLQGIMVSTSQFSELVTLFFNRDSQRNSMSHAEGALRAMRGGMYQMYQLGGGQGLIIIYLINNVYHIITPFNRIIRVTQVRSVVRILVNILQYQTPWQWMPMCVFNTAMASVAGVGAGSIIGLPMVIIGRLIGGLNFRSMMNALGVYGLAGGAAVVLWGQDFYLPRSEPEIDDDLD